jgi:light-harvesting complex I chlorophyll a/b binding protein 1
MQVLGEMQERMEDLELADLERSPRLQHLAAVVPEVRAVLEDPAKAQQLLNYLHAGARVLKGMRADIACREAACPQGSGELAALTGLANQLLAHAEDVIQDPELQDLLTDGGAAAPQSLGSLAGLFTHAEGFQAGLRASARPRADAVMQFGRKPAAKKPEAKKAAGNPFFGRKPAAKKPEAKKAAGNPFKRPSSLPAARVNKNANKDGRIGNFVPAKGSDIKPTDIGVLEPLGIYDPGNYMTNTASYAPFPWAPPQPQYKPDDTKYRRWQELEIKHGRIAMAATLHVFITTLGFKWPFFDISIGKTGASATGEALRFVDIPGGTWGSWGGIPPLGWGQIVVLIALLDNTLFAQDPNREPGDVVPRFLPWVRYDDSKPYNAPLGALWPFPGSSGNTYAFPSEKAYKLNVERNNGRAAMLGIFGMMIHEALTGNPVWPIPADVDTGIFGVVKDLSGGAVDIPNPLLDLPTIIR